jgi:geranylgeranyl pyrophosphate synthase
VHLDQLAATLGLTDLGPRLRRVDDRVRHVLVENDALLGPASARVAGAGGKRLRPALTIAAAALGGVFDDRVVSGATAVELVQIGSLVHDDLFDEAATRRGVPTIHAVEGPNHAVMAGDYILAKAGSEATRVSAAASGMLARTVTGLCVGQMLELETQFDVERTIDAHLRSIRGKTAVLFECSLRMGAMAAGLPDHDVDALGRYGEEFGMGFQLLDDVLDLIGDPIRLGKPAGNDVLVGVYTLPVLLALRGPRGSALERLLRRHTPEDVMEALAMVREGGTASEALSRAEVHNEAAAAALAGLAPSPLVEGLRSFPATYLRWALEAFVAPPYAEL